MHPVARRQPSLAHLAGKSAWLHGSSRSISSTRIDLGTKHCENRFNKNNKPYINTTTQRKGHSLYFLESPKKNIGGNSSAVQSLHLHSKESSIAETPPSFIPQGGAQKLAEVGEPNTPVTIWFMLGIYL